MAKLFVTDTAYTITNQALQIPSSYDYLEDYSIEKPLRDIRMHQILAGINKIMSVIIARAQFKQRNQE